MTKHEHREADTTGGPRARLTTRVAMWSATHRRLAVALWALVVVATFAISFVQAPTEATDVDMATGEAGDAARMIDEAGMPDPIVESVLITARSGETSDALENAAADAVSELQRLDDVAEVHGPIPSDDGTALLVQAVVGGDPATASTRVETLQEAVASVQADYSTLRVEEVGPASIDAEFQEWLDGDLERATTLSVPVTLVILLVVFGAIVMAILPVVLALASVASGLGLWALASQFVPDPGMVLHLLVLVGMAVGVDYSLFYLRRFREERHAGRNQETAIRIAATTAGHSVVVSGTAVILSMAGLYVAGDTVFNAMATGSILVVLIALVSSVTVLPAMLAGLGRFVDKPRIPVLWRISSGDNPRLVPAVTSRVLAHPVAALVASIAILGALAYPLSGMSLKASQVEDFPRTLETMQSYDRLLEAFPDETAQALVVARVSDGDQAGLNDEVDALGSQLADHPDSFGEVDDSWVAADGRTVVTTVQVPHELGSQAARDSLDLLRNEIVPATVGTVSSEVAVGGDVALDTDYNDNQQRTLPLVIGVVLVLVLIMMFAVYRSVTIAVITVVLNALSLAAAFGILTAVFQGSWAQGLLGFESTGHIVSWVPALLFVVLCGLSLDYHVFVVSRIRENAAAGMTAKAAIQAGVTRTAGVVTSAAVVMIAVFSIFGALSFVELKQIGVGLAVGIALDATIIRVVTLPAAMLLCCRFLWWPGTTGQIRTADVAQASAPTSHETLVRG